MFDECLALKDDDWEVYFYKGLSYRYMREFELSIEAFTKANEIHVNENTFLELGKVYQLVNNYTQAL